MNRTNYQLILLYLLGIFFLYPVLAHILMYQLDILTDKLPHGKFWLYMQVFFCGPALIILGLILYFKFVSIINRIVAIMLLVIGFYWLYNVVVTIIKEAA
jgi:hypothetical protein